MCSPLVSVIVPAYNAELFIGETLSSVLCQTYKNIEVLVVDDGSKDRTAEIVTSIAQTDSRVTLLRQSNKGVAAARNLAIQESSGDYIAPIDADDIWFPQKLEKQMQCMLQAEPSVGLVYAWSVFIDEENSLTERCHIPIVEGKVYIPLVNGSFLGNASSPLIRRACLEHVGGYNSQLREQSAEGCEDWDLYLRIAEHYQFRVLPELLIGYRLVVGSMSFNHAQMKKSFDLLMADVQQKHPELPAIIYRWSESSFDWYLALRNNQCGNHWDTIFYLYHAARLDFLPLLRPGFYRLFIASLLKILAKPVTSLIWLDHRSWLRFEKEFIFPQAPELSSLNNKQIKKHQRFPRKQFNQFLLHRWFQIERKCQASSQTARPKTSHDDDSLLYIKEI